MGIWEIWRSETAKRDGIHRYYWRVYALDEDKINANNVERKLKNIRLLKVF